MSATMFDGGWKNKKKKKKMAKTPKSRHQKPKFGQNVNDSKSQICNSFFENIISGIQI